MSTSLNPHPRIMYGALNLLDGPFAILGDSFDVGSAEIVYETLEALLDDGQVVAEDRTNNRAMRLSVRLKDVDFARLAKHERDLMLEAAKPYNTLSFDPGDGAGKVTVFDTFRAQPRFNRVDAREANGSRVFTLEIPALPHGRDRDLTVTTAGAVPEASSTLDACESTSGWSVDSPGTRTVDTSVYSEGSGSLRITTSQITNTGNTVGGFAVLQYAFAAYRTGLSASIPAGGYFGIRLLDDGDTFEIDGFPGTVRSGFGVRLTTSTGALINLSTDTAMKFPAAGGFTRYVWAISASATITAIKVSGQAFRVIRSSPPDPRLWIDGLELAATSSTSGQVLSALEIGGSARATGSIHLASAVDSVPLGQVLAFTIAQTEVPDGWKPDLRQFVYSSTSSPTSDTTASNNSYYPLATDYSASNPVIRVLASRLSGGANTMVALVKRLSGSGTRLIGVRATLLVGGQQIGDHQYAEVQVNLSTLDPADGWVMLNLGDLDLPPVPVQNATSTAVVELRLRTDVSGVGFDDLFALPAAGDLSIVDCGDGTVGTGSFSHVWIESPTPSQRAGAVWCGTSASRANAIQVSATVPGRHRMPPGTALAFVVSTIAQGPAATFTYFRRHLFHA